MLQDFFSFNKVMKRWTTFIFFLAATLLPTFFYLQWSLHSSHSGGVLGGLFSMVLGFPILRRHHRLAHVAFLSMGLLSFIFVFSLLKDFLGLLGFSFSGEWVYLASVVAVIIGTLKAHSGPRVVKLKLPIANLPDALNGLRIIQISDLHVGPTIRKNYVQKIVETVNALEGDIIALTGDIGDGPVDKHREDVAPLSKLASKLGVFYVPGNHEYYWNANEWMNVMNNLKAIVLLNRGKKLQHQGEMVFIGGVSDPAGQLKPDPHSVHESGHDAAFKILLSHRPGLATEAAALGFHLQLSGHTHGGQFFPWTLAVRFAHKHFAGHHFIQNMWLNVNTGTGSWGPFLRLGTMTEITQIDIFSSGKSLEKF